jgi:sugar lactone lactonase YvrE
MPHPARILPIALLASAGCTSGATGADTAATEPSSTAPTAIALPGDALFPEGIAARSDGTLFVGSLTDGSVLRIPPGQTEAVSPAGPLAPPVEVFVPAGALGERALSSAVGMLADEGLDVLWVCDGGGVDFSRETAIVGFSLDDGGQVVRHPLPGGVGLCNDLALDGAGNLYASDSFVPRIVRVPAALRTTDGSAEDWASDPAWAVEPGGFGPNGLAVAGDQLYVAHTANNAVYAVAIGGDGSAGAARALALDRTPDGLDGMKLAGDGGLVFVENYAGQLVHIALDGGAGGLDTLQDGLDGPTTFAFARGSAWVVEGQLEHLFFPDAGPPSLPFRVVEVPLDEALLP